MPKIPNMLNIWGEGEGAFLNVKNALIFAQFGDTLAKTKSKIKRNCMKNTVSHKKNVKTHHK